MLCDREKPVADSSALEGRRDVQMVDAITFKREKSNHLPIHFSYEDFFVAQNAPGEVSDRLVARMKSGQPRHRVAARIEMHIGDSPSVVSPSLPDHEIAHRETRAGVRDLGTGVTARPPQARLRVPRTSASNPLCGAPITANAAFAARVARQSKCFLRNVGISSCSSPSTNRSGSAFSSSVRLSPRRLKAGISSVLSSTRSPSRRTGLFAGNVRA